MAQTQSSDVKVDIRVSQGSNGPKLSLACSDRAKAVPLSHLLPALRSLTNSVVDAAVEREARAGREISCKAKCGACCRQLVPLSVTEARQLPELLAELNDDHRERVLKRFEAALAQLRSSGLLARLEKLASLSLAERTQLGIEYFREGIPCPFLEDESCSIHPVRPVVCRQFLVTSAPTHCANPSPEKVVPVTLAANVLAALQRLETQEPSAPQLIPLILAPFLDLGTEESAQTAPAWLSALVRELKAVREEEVGTGARAPDL